MTHNRTAQQLPGRSFSPRAGILPALLIATVTASAGVVLYTSSADFNAALGAAPKVVEDYETYGLNSTIADGTVLNGIRYDSFPAGKQGFIDNTWNKIGAQSLNLDRGDVLHNVFFDGDQLSISFTTPVRAFGFFSTQT